MSRICDLPNEVVEEIMLRMSPESLRQFKCVSKSWYAFINNPTFVAKHLDHTMKKKKMPSSRVLHFGILMTICRSEEQEAGVEKANYLLTLASDDSDVSDYIPCVTEDLKLCSFSVECQCNGIISLVRYRDSGILLLNPALREIKTLPINSCRDEDICCIGFGYDSEANDYQVVIVTEYGKAEVYALSTNSWKQISMDVEVDVSPHHCSSVYFTITSFHFGCNMFRSMPLPDYVQREAQEFDRNGYTEFGVWNELLVLLFLCKIDSTTVIEMWVMNSASSVCGAAEVSCSWTKHLFIGPLDGIAYFLQFSGNDVLYFRGKNDEIFSYNLRIQELVILSISNGSVFLLFM